MIHFDFGKLGNRRVLTRSGDGELIIRPLKPGETYVAISHTWGEDKKKTIEGEDDKETIETEDDKKTIEGIEWKVASWMSLERCEALVQAYDKVWIDSLCIHQDNKLDVAAQIKNMHNIYGDADFAAVVLTGDYRVQLDALGRLTQLLKYLRTLGRECTSSRYCPYIKTVEGIKEAVDAVSEIQWFKRVWTLQEAVVSELLTFVGFDQDGKLEDDVTTEEEIREFIHAFDLVDSEYWAGSITHPGCTQSAMINPLELCEKVVVIENSMRAIDLDYYKDTKRPQEQRRILEYTAYTVFKQLGKHQRDCKLIHDRVFGVCALLGIEISRVDYTREFADVFFEAVKKLVEHGICVLPLRPQLVHGDTWLPSLKDVDPKDSWKTVKTSCAPYEEEDTYHNVEWKGDRVYATGRLLQMVNPCKLRTSMEAIEKTLQDFVEAVRAGENFDVVGSIQNPDLLTMTCVLLWMHCNRGKDTEVTTKDVESVIRSVYNHTKSTDEVESSKDKNNHNILQEFDNAASHIKWHLDSQKFTTSQEVTYILECCGLVSLEGNSAYERVPLRDRDAILVAKKKFGFVLYSVPSSVQSSYNTYGLFYKQSLGVGAREFSCNVVVPNDDGVWDNHGDALCWYIDRGRNFSKRRICVGIIR